MSAGVFIGSIFGTAQAQTATYEVETLSAFGANGRTPFWIEANRHGVIPASSANVLSRFLGVQQRDHGDFRFNYGAEIIGRAAGGSSAFFNQLYAGVRYGGVELKAGRFAETVGLYDVPLSTGSFTTSGNATPLTKIVLRSADFAPLPFTGGWAEGSAYLAHGWFERGRFVRSPLLHEKHLYLRFGRAAPLNVHAGIVHVAMWGGRDHPEEGDLPASFNDYLRIVFIQEGDEKAPRADRIYVLGKHLGFWDFGVSYRFSNYRLAAYRHFTIEEGFAARFGTPEDGLLGISLRHNEKRRILTGILYEHLYTKRQTINPHPKTPGQVSNIYNHYLYRNGYSHHGRTLGSPLLFLAKPNFDAMHDLAVSENNRVVAHHLGMEGYVNRTWYRLLLTFSRNYGQYLDAFEMERTGIPHRFASGPRQFSSLLETLVPVLDSGFHFRLAIAADIGDVRPQNAGMMIGLLWRNVHPNL